MMAKVAGEAYNNVIGESNLENRIIVDQTKQTMKNTGYIMMGITLTGLAVYPQYREMYGAWTLGVSGGIGVLTTFIQGI